MEVLGIDIGGSGIKGALVNTQTGAMLTDRFRIPTPSSRKPEEMAEVVAQIAKQLIEMGCYEISLGDTTGKGSPDQTIKILNECLTFTTPDKLAGHFHDTFKNALNNIRVCLDHGIRTFDSSVGGLGGCPYSPGSKGNVATEKVNELLLSQGFETKLDTKRINECAVIALDLKMDGTYDWV